MGSGLGIWLGLCIFLQDWPFERSPGRAGARGYACSFDRVFRPRRDEGILELLSSACVRVEGDTLGDLTLIQSTDPSTIEDMAMPLDVLYSTEWAYTKADLSEWLVAGPLVILTSQAVEDVCT